MQESKIKERHMRFVIQRAKDASVSVDGNVLGSIDKGLVVLAGVSRDDDESVADKMVDKMIKLRIFEDSEGKTNLSLSDVGGSLLVISQFTLYANCKKGNRPSFTEAGAPDRANELYEYILAKCEERCGKVERGEFGADMKVTLTNDGPFTVILDSETL
jgi:D-tyrosyl-tRNA(Tyr) deacylase